MFTSILNRKGLFKGLCLILIFCSPYFIYHSINSQEKKAKSPSSTPEKQPHDSGTPKIRTNPNFDIFGFLAGNEKYKTCKKTFCNNLVSIDCDSAGDGPAYFINRFTGEEISVCGGACWSPGDKQQIEICKNLCPPEEWTCSSSNLVENNYTNTGDTFLTNFDIIRSNGVLLESIKDYTLKLESSGIGNQTLYEIIYNMNTGETKEVEMTIEKIPFEILSQLAFRLNLAISRNENNSHQETKPIELLAPIKRYESGIVKNIFRKQQLSVGDTVDSRMYIGNDSIGFAIIYKIIKIQGDIVTLSWNSKEGKNLDYDGNKYMFSFETFKIGAKARKSNGDLVTIQSISDDFVTVKTTSPPRPYIGDRFAEEIFTLKIHLKKKLDKRPSLIDFNSSVGS